MIIPSSRLAICNLVLLDSSPTLKLPLWLCFRLWNLEDVLLSNLMFVLILHYRNIHIFPQVPFLDVCNTLLHPILPLTAIDYEEFGFPVDHEEFLAIRKYSPYDNIQRDVPYPAVFVTSSFNTRYVTCSFLGTKLLLSWPGPLLTRACNFHHFNRFLHSSIAVFTLCYILMPDICK